MTYFEDLTLGAEEDLGAHCFTKEDIIAFAKTHAPRAPYLEGARASPWHVVGTWMRIMMEMRVKQMEKMVQDNGAQERPAMPGISPGFLDMTWPHPVHAGDRILYRTRIAEKILLRSRPQWGIVRNRNEGVNEKGDLVLSFLGQALFERRDAGATSS